MFDWLRYDVRHAVRGMLRDRAFTMVALLSIGLGVGANSAIFSLVDQALYRRLPVREPDQLVLLNWKGPALAKGWGSGNLMSNPLFRQVKAENKVFDGVFARHPTSTLFAVDGGPEPVNTDIVSGSYFGVLGVRPALGRTREIGIRMVLGATRGAALWLVVRDTAVMVTFGIAIALPAVWALGRLVESQLFGVTAMDGASIVAATALVATAALAAAALPARRATALNPVEALRTE
jgi:hypothetical protein